LGTLIHCCTKRVPVREINHVPRSVRKLVNPPQEVAAEHFAIDDAELPSVTGSTLQHNSLPEFTT